MNSIRGILLALLLGSFCFGSDRYIHPLDNMPILNRQPHGNYGALPLEQRNEEFRKFLSKSVKIKTSSGSGSGSIVFYDKERNLAYVASCGHLWASGVLNSNEAKSKKIECKVVTWYKNNVKLRNPEEFDAKLLFYSYTSEIDTALLVFSPDWVPEYFPIAPFNYRYEINSFAHSCGCDGGREVAHYEVTILEVNNDLVTIRNSPRPGRSGGGLFDENLYIGTCWGTEYVDGSGRGFFTPIKDIHSFWSRQKGYEFLLMQHSKILGMKIPIKDRNSKQQVYQESYILAP